MSPPKNRYRSRFRDHRSPLSRGEHESMVSIVCEVCFQHQLHWYTRLPPGAGHKERCVPFVCSHCDSQLMGYITDDWLEWAEKWRPWQDYINHPHRYRPPGTLAVALPGEAPLPEAPCEPDRALRPDSLRTHILERVVQIRHVHFFLSSTVNVDAFVVRVWHDVTDIPWPGSKGRIADIAIFYPPEGQLRELLLRLYDLGEDVAEGAVVNISAVKEGTNTNQWRPASQSSDGHHRLQELVEETPSPEPDSEPAPAEPPAAEELDEDTRQWMQSHVVPLLPDHSADEELHLTEVEGEWLQDDDTHPGVIVDGEE